MIALAAALVPNLLPTGNRTRRRGAERRGQRHFCRKLSRAGDRSDSRPERRPRRHRSGGRRPHGFLGRPIAGRCLQGSGPRYHYLAARHDDRRRQSAAFRLLRRRQCLDHGARQSTFDPARCDRRDFWRFFRLSGERCNLPGADPSRAGVDACAGASAVATCWPWRWRRMSGRPRRSPAIRRTS